MIVGIFDPALLTVAPLTFSLVQVPPPPPCSLFQSTVCITDSMAGRVWGVLSPVKDHILQEFNTLYLTRFRTYKIVTPPQASDR
jgi:hypothetical protein